MSGKLFVLIFLTIILLNTYAESEQFTEETNNMLKLDVKIHDEYKQILSGEKILLEINLQRLKDFEQKDVYVIYMIKDLGGNIITTESETFAILTKTSVVKNIFTPASIKAGNYLLYVKASYNDVEVDDSDSFEIIKEYPRGLFFNRLILVFGIVLLVLLVYYYISYKRFKSLTKKLSKIDENKLAEKNYIKR